MTLDKARAKLLTKCAGIMLEGPVKGASVMGGSPFYKKLALVVDEGRYDERKRIIGYLMDAEGWNKHRVIAMLELLDAHLQKAQA